MLQGEFFQNPGGVSGFYEFQIEKSVHFERGASHNTYMSRALSSSAGTNSTWGMSVWVKRGITGDAHSYILGNGGGYHQTGFNSDDEFLSTTGGGGEKIQPQASSTSNARTFRDTSSWMHIVLGSGSSSSDRFMYVNGVAQTLSTNTWNGWSYFYGGQTLNVGASNDGSSGTRTLGGQLAELHVLYGSTPTYTDFGKFKQGVWIPIQATGISYGTYGFYLDFKNASNLGEDQSGNNNDFTVNNMDAGNQNTDTPTFTE